MDEPDRGPFLSLVVPVHDEEGNLAPLWDEISSALERIEGSVEVLFVNDGSTDGSSLVLDELRAGDARIRVLDHDGNRGLTAALSSGFQHARGEVIGMLDADGQNPPAAIVDLLAALPGADMVIGWRRDRRDPWLKRASSLIANAYRNWRALDDVHDTACGLKVLRREVVSRLKLYDGLHRFLPTLARMEGFRVVEVPVPHRPRVSGRSHYGVWNRLWKGLRDVRTVRWMWANHIAQDATERPRPGGSPRSGGG